MSEELNSVRKQAGHRLIDELGGGGGIVHSLRVRSGLPHRSWQRHRRRVGRTPPNPELPCARHLSPLGCAKWRTASRWFFG